MWDLHVIYSCLRCTDPGSSLRTDIEFHCDHSIIGGAHQQRACMYAPANRADSPRRMVGQARKALQSQSLVQRRTYQKTLDQWKP